MAFLPVDTTTGVWRQVKEYSEARVLELTEVCTSLQSSDEQRRDAAARIEELRELTKAPGRCRTITESRPLHFETNGSY